MIAVTTAQPPRPLRRAVGAVMVAPEQYDAWHALASAVPGLNAVEIGVLAAIWEHFRQREERGYCTTLSYDRMAYRLNINHVAVRWAVYKLVELGLLGVERGGGGKANEYRMTLPRKQAAALQVARSAVAAGDDDDQVPPF